jgi:hypothetical protein
MSGVERKNSKVSEAILFIHFFRRKMNGKEIIMVI